MELKPNFIALAIKKKLNEASQSNKISACSEVVEFFFDKLSDKSNIPTGKAIKTRSNLSYEVFKEIVDTVGFDFSFYEMKRNIINEKLLKRRNEIAHGQNITFDISEFEYLLGEIRALMDYFKNQIDNSVSLKSYKKN